MPTISSFSSLAPRSQREWLLYAALLLALPWLFFTGPAWLSSESGRALSNLAHIPLFGLVAYLIQGRIGKRRWHALLWITLITLLAGGLIEALQWQVGREASVADIWRNLAGAWLVWSWWSAPGALVWLGRVATSLTAGFYLLLTLQVVALEIQARHQLPLLADFESEAALYRWRGSVSRSDLHPSHGRFAMRSELPAGEFPGLELTILGSDWRGYSKLRFDLFNPNAATLELVLRIHDRHHDHSYDDRFNKTLQIAPGWNHVAIDLEEVRLAPKERVLDLSAVAGVILFASWLPETRVIYTDYWRLE